MTFEQTLRKSFEEGVNSVAIGIDELIIGSAYRALIISVRNADGTITQYHVKGDAILQHALFYGDRPQE